MYVFPRNRITIVRTEINSAEDYSIIIPKYRFISHALRVAYRDSTVDINCDGIDRKLKRGAL